MSCEDGFPKFTEQLGKFISSQWTRIKNSSSSSQSEKNIDQQLEEEYEILLREIDYLTADKSCYMSFINDNFYNGQKSSEDLSAILKKHSSEVLINYWKNHDKEANNENFIKRQDLINYVTEIVVSKHKSCNNKLCSCKPIKVSKEVLTDSSVPQNNGKETQTSNVSNASSDKAIDVKPINTETANQTKHNQGLNNVNITIQTDDWSHDPFCKCGCCPKTGSEIDTKSLITDEKPVQDATTSDRKITASKNVSANCFGENVASNTSNRFCVPSNFEELLENNQKFAMCSEKKDCACDAYDVKEALQRGLILPSSDICIQKKKVRLLGRNKNGKEKKKKIDFSDGNEATDDTTSSDNKKTKAKKKDKNKSKGSTPREQAKKERGGLASCFGPRRRSGCDEYCLGKSQDNRSMQTLALRTWDKSEGVETSPVSEEATQVSAKSSKNNLKRSKQKVESEVAERKPSRKFLSKQNKQDKETLAKGNAMQDQETWSKEDNMQDRDNETYLRTDDKNIEAKPSRTDKRNKESSTNKDTEQEKNKDKICSKCGRFKRECISPCRNTIVIPYASRSNRALPTGEVDSLRMLVKMQSRDTNRQLDNIMTELNHQKSEVRRLNNMYQKMMENYYEMQSRSHSKQSSDCLCSSKRFDAVKECGCTVSNECKILNNETPTGMSYDTAGSNNSRAANNIQLKRFGPPNTAVSINRCDVCNVEVTGNGIRACVTRKDNNYQDGDKQQKDRLNLSKKAEKSKLNVSTRRDNIRSGGTGDSLPQADSVSTIYKNDKKQGDQIERRGGPENYLDNIDYIKESEDPGSAAKRNVIEIETDSDNSEPGKKSRGLSSSRILIWFKKSWVSIKHKADDCKKREKKRREEQAWKCLFKYCEYKAKQAATGIWKVAKNAAKPF